MDSLFPVVFNLYFTILLYIFLVLLFITVLYIYLSNPFRKLTIVRSVFSSALIGNTLFLFKNGRIHVNNGPLWRGFSWVKAGGHILKNALFPAPGANGKTVQEIIRSIHTLRFDPDKPYLISGDHFSMFYPRNLGIFYFCLLDPRTALDYEDWVIREKKCLQSVAYALETFSQAGDCSTTIVPTGRHQVTMINVFAYPSDTLYGILHALYTMKTPEFFFKNYPFEAQKHYPLHTSDASEDMLQTYSISLKQLYARYRRTVYDKKTGLIRTGLKLSSHLDTKIRSSAFYDNVVFWRTSWLANKLGIVELDAAWLRELKKRIVDTFWFEEGGYFLDDLSEETLRDRRYASDWVIILTTGFLNPLRKAETAYFERTVAYVRKMRLDEPFPLKVLGSPVKQKDHFWVRTFVSNYQDSAIWSNLGQQYIKILTLLYAATGNGAYLHDAGTAIAAYRRNMLRYRGYPEVYDCHGNMLQNRFYRSIRQTSWVVDFEHSMALYDAYAVSMQGKVHRFLEKPLRT
ncbi:MAG: hypothetical protein N2691_02235 [Patescibacteria group bacterium]|nr:hypothetical protein [Patescibacteria group bacterium]